MSMVPQVIYKQNYFHRGRASYRGGGRGGFISLMILARGDIPPIKLQNSVFFNGHFSEVLQESVQKTNPLF